MNNKKVNSYDISIFLRDNGKNYYSVDLIDVISAYDANNQGCLDQSLVEKLFVTYTDSILAKRANARYEEYVGFRDRLAPEVELGMCKILATEIEELKKLNKEKEILKNRFDFSKLDAFRAIDNHRLNSILRDDIKHFMNRNGIYATALDAENLFRRIDMD